MRISKESTLMPYKVPVGGVFAAVYYDYEDSFNVYGSTSVGNPGTNPDAYYSINKILGQGVKITTWEEKNNVSMVRGLNNIEAATSVDGAYEGTLTLEFDAIGDVDWLSALMGSKNSTFHDLPDTLHFEYTKAGIPKTMIFVIMIQNDPDNSSGGDIFVLRGVVFQDATLHIEDNNTPFHVTMNCAYSAETPFTVDDMPVFYTPADNVFNFGQAAAYFWDSTANAEAGDPASFDSFETICKSLDIRISHGVELIRGIGSRVARDRFNKYLEYTVNLESYYKDKERFLEKFYGCPSGPVSDNNVPPFDRVLVVVENSKQCGDGYRRLEFEFNEVKLNTRSSVIDIEEAITEKYEMMPLHLTIRAWNGATPLPEFAVAPYHVKQGDVVSIHGKFFPRGGDVTLKDGANVIASVPVNCTGSFEYRTATYLTTNWQIGKHEISVVAYSGSDIEGPMVVANSPQTIIVTGSEMESVPTIVACPQQVFVNTATMMNIKGYNFANYSEETSLLLTVYTASGVVAAGPQNIAAYISNVEGTPGSIDYDYSLGALSGGNYYVEVAQGLLAGGTNVADSPLYVSDITYSAKQSGTTYITGTGFAPLERIMLYVQESTEFASTGTWIYISSMSTDSIGYVRFSIPTTIYPFGATGDFKIRLTQKNILSNGQGDLGLIEDATW
jgi:hypothetical protein